MNEGRPVGGECGADESGQICGRGGADAVGAHRDSERREVRRAQPDADGRNAACRLLILNLPVAATVHDDHRYRKSLLYKRCQLLDGEHQRAVAEQNRDGCTGTPDGGTQPGGQSVAERGEAGRVAEPPRCGYVEIVHRTEIGDLRAVAGKRRLCGQCGADRGVDLGIRSRVGRRLVPARLLRQADVSMYAGKRVGKDTAVIYRPSLGVSTDFPTALRQADGGAPAGFSLVFQPVVTLPDATPVAFEALARWTAPNGTDIQPDAFVAAAEAAGLGAVLDDMVLDLACSELESAGVDMVLHVNIGAARLGSLEFERRVLRTLDRCGLTPSQLVLEVTETVPVVDLADAAAQITRLNAVGIRVALDDFGAGYSSLTYLHALPVQIIKLDRGLAVGPEPARIETLYRSVVRLCNSLGVDVIAEGIESTAQADTVFSAGCRLAQGHLFGRAVPIVDLGVPREVPSGR